MPPRRYRFSDRQRVRSSRDFERIMRAGVRVTNEILTAWAQPNELGFARLGLVVGRRHGNAPRRNRIKRLVREAFRLMQHDLPPLDLLISPRPGVEFTVAALEQALTRATNRLLKLLPDRAENGA